MDNGLVRAYRFFRDNGYGIVGARATVALELAKAERTGRTHGLLAVWGPEEAPDLSWMTDAERDEDHVVEYCAIYTRCACCGHKVEVLASLGNIVDADAAYRRVVEAELFAEALTRWTPPGPHEIDVHAECDTYTGQA